MGGCASLGRVVLVILNIIFVLVSLGLIVVGAILKYMPGTILTFVMAGINTLIPTATPLFAGITLPNSLEFVPVFDDLGVALLIGGSVLFVISFLACCGACYQWRPLLILFVIIMIVILVIFAAFGGLFLVKDSVLHENIKKGLVQTAIKDSKNGPMEPIMNLLSITLDCCGISGPQDYVSNWKNNLTALPKVCCAALDGTCATLSVPQIRPQGCYSRLMQMIEDNKIWAIVGLVGLLVLFLLEVIFAVVIVVDVGDKNKVRPV